MSQKKSLTLSLVILTLLLTVSASLAQDAAEPIKIGVLQLVEHVSLDASYEGFVDALAEAGYIDGETISIDFQNAQADQSNMVTISERFVKNKVDLILAIATPAAQAVAAATTEIPVIFTAVTDPVEARLVESMEKPGMNITGVSDAGPIDEQIGLFLTLKPDIKTIGILYNSSEVNSEIQAKQAEKIAEDLGLKVKFGTVTSVNDIEQVLLSIAGEVEGIYLPTDNTFASAMANVAKVTEEKGLIVIAGAQGMVEEGGLATIGLDYYKLGVQTGKLAVRVLNGEADPATTPVELLEDTDLLINLITAEAIGYTFSEELMNSADIIISEADVIPYAE